MPKNSERWEGKSWWVLSGLIGLVGALVFSIWSPFYWSKFVAFMGIASAILVIASACLTFIVIVLKKSYWAIILYSILTIVLIVAIFYNDSWTWAVSPLQEVVGL